MRRLREEKRGTTSECIGRTGRRAENSAREAQALREANLLREFAGALKRDARTSAVPIEQKLGVFRVVDWIERHANSIDLLTDVAEVIRQFDNRSP
jgi:hypothetical protein